MNKWMATGSIAAGITPAAAASHHQGHIPERLLSRGVGESQEDDTSFTEYQETVMAQGRGARFDNADIDKTFRSVVAESQPEPRDNSGQEPHKTKSDANFMAGIAHPLLALYNLVAGPPMTQRDRHRRAIGEANVRSNAGLSWFNRTTW